MRLTSLRVLASYFIVSALCLAQSGNASLTGAVQDTSAAVVPNAGVTIRNTETGVAHEVITNSAGLYYAPNLIPGAYTVLVEAKGFKIQRIDGVQLTIDQQARIDVELKVGQLGQEIAVTGAPPLLQTEDPSVGTVISGQQVEDLPLNGRQFTQLLQLSPGTLPSTNSYLYKNADASSAGRQRNGMPVFDVNGGSGAFVTFRLDGVDNSETEFGGANIPVSIDAIGEVKIQTANFSAEYGRGPSQVDVTTKSGTNQLHGTLFEFLRNDAMDATQWQFTGPHTVSLLKRNQFGGTVGGPIRKDKLFYFFSYDGTREILSAPQTTTVPTDDMRKGVFPSGVLIFDPDTQKQFLNNTIPSSRFEPIAQKMLSAIPAPNLPGVARKNAAGFDLAPTLNYFFDPQRRRTIDQYNLRMDYAVSARNSLSGRFTQSSNDILGDGPLATNLGSIIGTERDKLGGRNVGASWLFNIRPAIINELRFGVATNPQLYDTVDKTNYISQFGVGNFLVPNAPLGLPAIQIGTVNVSGGNTRPFHVSETNYQLVDNLTIVHGKHTMRMGGDMYRGYRTPFNTARSRGQFRFNGAQTRDRNFPTVSTTFCPNSTVATSCTAGDAMADFLLGDLSFFEAGSPEPEVRRHVTSWDGYFWDSWHLRPRLTLSLGLRYEYLTRLTSDPGAYGLPIIVNGEFSGKVAVANDSSGKITSLALPSALAAFPGVAVTCRSVGLPDNCVTSLKRKFQPRLGFAWQINNKTVFRGGAGTFYGHVLGDYETEEGTATFPILLDKTTQTIARPPAGNAPPPLMLSNPLSGLSIPAPALSSNQSIRKDPNTYQWNVTLERELMKDTQLSAAYVATLGRNLETFPPTACCNFNVPQPWGIVLAPGQTQKVAVPAFSTVSFYAYQDTSNYQSLQVKLNRRFSGGLALVVSFTHARSMNVNNGFSDPRYPTKGPAYNDVPNTIVVSPIWQIPVGAGQRFLNRKGVVNQVLGGWKLSGILSDRSGFLFTPVLSGTNLIGYTTRNELPDRVCSGKLDHPTVFNWFDKNCFTTPKEPTTPGAPLHEGNSGMDILRGPTAFSLDTGLSKTFALTEKHHLDFRAEAFNVLNHPTFGLPSATIAAGGNQGPAQIAAAASVPRVMQLALKLRF